MTSVWIIGNIIGIINYDVIYGITGHIQLFCIFKMCLHIVKIHEFMAIFHSLVCF